MLNSVPGPPETILRSALSSVQPLPGLVGVNSSCASSSSPVARVNPTTGSGVSSSTEIASEPDAVSLSPSVTVKPKDSVSFSSMNEELSEWASGAFSVKT